MRRFSCIIVDDEPVARSILEEFVRKVSFLGLAASFENLAKADVYLHGNKTDIIFLDIEMPKQTGLEWLQESRVNSVVILTTAFPQYALQGYELDIIDYLLKPFAFNRFQKAVQKAKEFIQLKETKSDEVFSSFIFVRSDKRIEKVELNDIFFIESLGNYVMIYAAEKKIIAYLTLKSLEHQLSPSHFIMIHQSYLVNCSRIDSIEGNEIKIQNHALPLGRKYKDDFMQMVGEKLLKR